MTSMTDYEEENSQFNPYIICLIERRYDKISIILNLKKKRRRHIKN